MPATFFTFFLKINRKIMLGKACYFIQLAAGKYKYTWLTIQPYRNDYLKLSKSLEIRSDPVYVFQFQSSAYFAKNVQTPIKSKQERR